MLLIPAIDLKEGHCVRLRQGRMEDNTVFSEDPLAVATRWVEAGAKRLHMVDLDGAFAGKPENTDAVTAVLEAVDIKVQLGGGIRDMKTIEGWLARGLARVILGTVAVRDPDLVLEACKAFPGQVALGIDARDGFVAVQGWAEATELKTEDLAKRFEDAGAAALIFTDIGRDGAMQGPNLDATLALADAVSIPVILSGGVSSMAALETIAARAAGKLAGVISGRAVYDGRIDPATAQALLTSAEAA